MLYALIGLVTGVATLVVGIFGARREADGTFDLTFLVFLAFLGAIMAGVAWPATLLIGAIVGGIKWAEHRKNSAPPAPPKPLSDSERYRKMAAEQRALAVQARKDGMDDLAEMQENLAAQYEQAANIYRNTKETA